MWGKGMEWSPRATPVQGMCSVQGVGSVCCSTSRAGSRGVRAGHGGGVRRGAGARCAAVPARRERRIGRHVPPLLWVDQGLVDIRSADGGKLRHDVVEGGGGSRGGQGGGSGGGERSGRRSGRGGQPGRRGSTGEGSHLRHCVVDLSNPGREPVDT